MNTFVSFFKKGNRAVNAFQKFEQSVGISPFGNNLISYVERKHC